jgi:hypothetical protein
MLKFYLIGNAIPHYYNVLQIHLEWFYVLKIRYVFDNQEYSRWK